MNPDAPAGEGAAPRVLVIQNSLRSSLDRFEGWWAEDGLDLRILPAFREDDPGTAPAPVDVGDYAAVVMLGGGFMVDDEEAAPWIVWERSVVADALTAGMPILGICLGGQLLAHVAGGRVQGGHGLPECGSTPLTIRPEAAGDELFGELPGTVPAMEHRQDAITGLPVGAVWLASSERCPVQGFRLGDQAWGLQFHPEMSLECIDRWSPESTRAWGFEPTEVLSRSRADEPVSTPIWRAFARRFASVVIREAERAGSRALEPS